MKKRNKIISIVMLSLLVIGLVTAGVLDYFGIIEQSGNITQAIVLKQGDTTCGNSESGTPCTEPGNVVGGETITSKEYTLTSEASVVIPVNLTTIVSPTEGTDTKIVGTLVLTKKTISDWQPTGTAGDTIEINYTIVGDTFESSGVPEGYTLIYYKDKGTYITDEERLLVLGESAVLSENMPHTDDWNAGELADYCNNGIDVGYTHCKGAKLWAVPDANIEGGILIWSSPEMFYFETDLIEYNKEGYITIYPDEILDFKVETTFSTGYVGPYNITTEAQIV